MSCKINALAVLAAACFVAQLKADVTGTIVGAVRDASGASVIGAQVSATNTANNFTRETKSDGSGEFRLLALPPGPYRVTATATGFDQFVSTGIDLKVNDQLRVDVSLKVGTVKESVTVEASSVQVETESTQLGQVFETKQILSLPLNGRSYIDLLSLQAGVAPTTSGSIQQDRPVSGISSAGNVSVNGQRETANAFLVNGGDVSEGRNLGAGLIPNLDSIQEFRLITNSFDPEYGKFSGSVMNAITKSGGNGVHGDGFEFLRNDALDARNFFDPSKAELRRNQFGYAVGGPFWRNKLFWFTDYQGTRQTQGASTGLVDVPTVAQRQGQFDPSTFVDSNGNPTTVEGAYWASVLSQRLGYTVKNGEQYSTPGCATTADCVFPGGTIPQSAFSKPAVGILPYIPVPNQANGFYANSSQKNTVRDDKMGQRVDFVNEKTGNWGFYYHFDDSTVNNALPAASVPGFPSTTPTRAQMMVMSNTKTFGGSQVNEFRLSFFRTSTHTDEPKGSFASLSSLGFVTGANTLGINPSGPAGFPQTVPPIYFNNFSIGVPTLTTGQPNNTYQASDSFSKVIGKHTMKVGGEFRYLQINELAQNPQFGDGSKAPPAGPGGGGMMPPGGGGGIGPFNQQSSAGGAGAGAPRQGARGGGSSSRADILQGERSGNGYSSPVGTVDASGTFSGYGTSDQVKNVDLRRYLPGAQLDRNRKLAGIGSINPDINTFTTDLFKRISDRFKVVCSMNRLRDCTYAKEHN